ncbi:MFS transporter [Micromonospora polyrhachis]|uniref:DHA2 family multidrug resistance protein-like MFS transporter n=1 Tax=Micromonospora polyrhachis TaxID=1282883 RepID=A0A7W7WMV8_9ACTN|nr:MFS transporter [Micromonospora polyrhachis]MBB4957215.1 DHA2 family multidrug resistance protein-like MFS transporter [Micromonospora polyrhachis]
MYDPTGPEPGPRAGRREWIGLAVLALPTLLVSLDMSVLFLALPQLSEELGAGGNEQLWILDSYGFLVAGFLVTMGTLGDRIGRRRLLLIGASAFAAASVLAAYAPSTELLIAARALLGIAGATLMPSTLALIRNMFHDDRQRGVAIAVWMSCFMAGNTIGPLIGGVLLEWFWWGSVFLLGVPVMVLLVLTAPALLPEHRDPDPGRLDLISVALSLGAILPVVYGLKELATEGWRPGPAAAVVLGVALGWLFVRRQHRLPHPLLDLRLFADRTFRAALGINFLGAVLMSGTFLFIPLYLRLVEGLSPLQAGLWLVPQSLAMIASTQLTPYLAGRFRPAYVMAGALVVAAVGGLLLSQVGPVGGRTLLVVGFLLACVGVAPPSALATGLVVGSAPPGKAGATASVSETSGELGVALGLATLGSLGAAAYRDQLVLPDGVPGRLAETARESLAGAIAASGQLSTGSAAALVDSARGAFTSGLNVVGGVGALLFLALAILAVATLRRVDPTGQSHVDPPQTDSGSDSGEAVRSAPV